MTESPSAEPAKAPKKKGTRSVSSLTPAQLARKRANDREAQRAIRARTKEHIERLERELDEVKRSREELFRQNEALRNEVRELATINQALMPGRPYPTPGYNVDGLTPAVSGVPSRASSLGQSSGDFGTTAPGYGTSYLPTPESCGDSWSSIIQVPAHSVVSSPCSSTAHPDDYATGYTPTSMPASMMTSSVIPAENITSLDESKMEFGDINSAPADHVYPQPNVSQPSPYTQQRWSFYPPASYFANPS